jgi:multidrug resistance efflux pump
MRMEPTMPAQKPAQSATAELIADNQGDRRREINKPSDAAALQARLQDEVARQQPGPAPAGKRQDSQPDLKRRADDVRPPKKPYSKLIKSIIGIAVVAVVGWMPVQRLFETSSVQAVLNATIVTVRAPINGTVGGPINQLYVGKSVALGNPLVMVDNLRVDTGEVDHAAEMVAANTADLAGLRQRMGGLEELRAAAVARVETYRADRALRLTARIAEADARIAYAKADHNQVAADYSRATALVEKQIKSAAEGEELTWRLAASNARIEEAEAARAVLGAEQDALTAGRFLGDDYNDAPRSAQRVNDIDEMLVQLRADATRLRLQLNNAQQLLMQEAEQLNPLRHATLDAPVTGRVWEVLTAPGEQIVAGQHLLSLVDCSKLLVTAAVSQSVYNSLSLGTAVEFHMDGSKVQLPGSIAQLSGVAAAGSNFAIDPSALTQEAYRVGVAVDTRQLGDTCPVGRTGRVVFKKQ